MKNFTLISNNADVVPLRAAVLMKPHLWNQNTLRTKHPGTAHSQVDDIWLRFNEIDPKNPERSTKLLEKNTSDELKVPGGFMFPLCLGVMASRQGTHVTIFLETFSNKSHGIKLDALDSDYDPFGTQHWVSEVTTSFLAKWNDSILQCLHI